MMPLVIVWSGRKVTWKSNRVFAHINNTGSSDYVCGHEVSKGALKIPPWGSYNPFPVLSCTANANLMAGVTVPIHFPKHHQVNF